MTPADARTPAELRTRRRFFAALGGLVLLVNLPLLSLLRDGRPAVPATLPLQETFDGASGPPPARWWSGGSSWRLLDGRLHAAAARNNPLWLDAALPRDVRISFTAMALGAHGDVKVELFGNGRDHASGYVLVLGGWKNTVTVLARLDEHGLDRLETATPLAQQGVAQRWELTARGARLTWRLDGETVLELEDPAPLRGPGHDRFAFSGWESDVLFDDLLIEAL